MMGFSWRQIVDEQEGSSLLVALIMITVMMALVGSIIAFNLTQYRFIRRDAHRVQARYAAEAGIYRAMDSLQFNPYWRPANPEMTLPDGQESRIRIEPFGGYLFIRSEARYRKSYATARALVGEAPPPSFQQAVMMWDVQSSLEVAGTTRIHGGIVVSPRGVRESVFKRRRFTGRIDPPIHKVRDLRPPFFDGKYLSQVADQLDQTLLNSVQSTASNASDLPLAKRLPADNPVHYVPGDLHLTAEDSLLFKTPITIIARGDIILEGSLHFLSGTVVAAGKSLLITGTVTGREGLFYGRDFVTLSDSVRCSGQFFSRNNIRVEKDVYLQYPSVLYIAGETAEFGGHIRLESGARFDGTMIHPPLNPRPRIPRGRIVVEPSVEVRGAIFNALETEFHGTLSGSLMSRQFYFYDSPTNYINWLKDVWIDMENRPIHFVLPLLFSVTPRLAVVSWEVHVDETPFPS